MTTSHNTIISDYLDTDLSVSLDPVRGITRVFRKPLLIDSSHHGFEIFAEGRKMSSQPWIHIAEDLIYIYFPDMYLAHIYILLTSYEGRKMNNKMWLSMAREFS